MFLSLWPNPGTTQPSPQPKEGADSLTAAGEAFADLLETGSPPDSPWPFTLPGLPVPLLPPQRDGSQAGTGLMSDEPSGATTIPDTEALSVAQAADFRGVSPQQASLEGEDGGVAFLAADPSAEPDVAHPIKTASRALFPTGAEPLPGPPDQGGTETAPAADRANAKSLESPTVAPAAEDTSDSAPATKIMHVTAADTTTSPPAEPAPSEPGAVLTGLPAFLTLHQVSGGSQPLAALASPLPQQIMQALITASSQNGPIELVLTPEDLGRLRFDVQPDGDRVHVVLSAERPETMDLLRRHATDLIAELKASGYSGASLSFGQWGGGEARPQHRQQTFTDLPLRPLEISFIIATQTQKQTARPGGLDLRF